MATEEVQQHNETADDDKDFETNWDLIVEHFDDMKNNHITEL